MVYIDFEFNRPADPDMGLICCSMQLDNGPIEDYWLLDGSDKKRLCDRLCELDNEVFVAYNVSMAEARCFYALGLMPSSFKWRDLMLEWKWLRNGDDRYTYGDVISSDGTSVSWSIKPSRKIVKRMTKDERDEVLGENARECSYESAFRHCKVTNQTAGMGLLDCEYFFGVISSTDVINDKATKHEIRDELIVGSASNPDALQARKNDIMKYCGSDIHLLADLEKEITLNMEKVAKEVHLCIIDGKVCESTVETIKPVADIQLGMGHWAAQLATYACRGIPLNMDKYRAVKGSIAQVTAENQMDWNRTHAENPIYRIGPSKMMLEKSMMAKKQSPYVKMTITKDSALIADMIDRYCEDMDIEWARTQSGSYSMDSNYLKEMDDGALIHEYKKHNDGLTSLKAMAVKDDGTVKLDLSIGSDNKQHPDFGPYGAKTGRNASKASTFIFLGPKWFRILVDPKEGRYVCDLDAHSEEVAIAAAIYNDEDKREVYRSADVYMKYAQLAGAYPKDKPILTEDQRDSEKWFKEEHWDRVRKIYKSGFLGMQFGMGGSSLQRRVVMSLPENERGSISPEFGNDFVDDYHRTFAAEFDCVSELKKTYQRGCGGVVLADGWRIGGDEPNILTIGNFPVQGTGAVILREACDLMDKAGIKLYATLHDAVSITGKLSEMDSDIKTASECFSKAAENVLGEKLMLIGNPEKVLHGENWLHSSDSKDVWNRMAEKYFSQYVIKDK